MHTVCPRPLLGASGVRSARRPALYTDPEASRWRRRCLDLGPPSPPTSLAPPPPPPPPSPLPPLLTAAQREHLRQRRQHRERHPQQQQQHGGAGEVGAVMPQQCGGTQQCMAGELTLPSPSRHRVEVRLPPLRRAEHFKLMDVLHIFSGVSNKHGRFTLLSPLSRGALKTGVARIMLRVWGL